MEAKDLKIRCSSLGAIMTNSRTKKEPLSKTCKSKVQEIFKEKEFGISNHFTNQYVEKGLIVEDLSINLITEVNDLPFVIKNEYNFQNDFITGTPDALIDELNLVIEAKSSWNINTFPMFEETNPTKAYEWQVQGYMWLTGKSKAILSYCLIDTPEELVQDEIFRTARKNGYIDLPEEVEAEIRINNSFAHIDKRLRCKTFHFERNEEMIKQIQMRVLECRNYYNELLNQIHKT